MNETIDVIVQPAIEPKVIDSNLTLTWNNAELAKYLEEKLEKYNWLVVTDEKLKEMKSLAKEISEIELQLICFGNDSNLEYQQRKITEQLTELILEL